MSLLENYYDRFWAERFDATFAGTDVGQHPTGEQSRYVVLRFDFSAVNDTLETLEREFETYCHIELEGTLERHPDLFPEAVRQRLLALPSIATKLSALFRYAADHDIPLSVLIDEYDNFANTVLAHHGAEAYHDFTHGGGFYRNFFATLKAATARSGGGLERLFIIGVSPVTMDDVTSGFNIGTNVSLHPDFNEMVGFTEAEVRYLVETYRDHGVFNQDADTAMGIMGDWYNGYRFATTADTDLYNTDMVLYYLKDSIPNRGIPEYLIDTNVRIDYGKLRHRVEPGAAKVRKWLRASVSVARLATGFDRAHSDRCLDSVAVHSVGAVHVSSGLLPRLLERSSFPVLTEPGDNRSDEQMQALNFERDKFRDDSHQAADPATEAHRSKRCTCQRRSTG